MVGADDLVAIGDVRARPQEERAIVRHAVQEHVGIPRHHLDVLGGDPVGFADHLSLVVADDDLAVRFPRLARGLARRQARKLPLHFVHRVPREPLRIGQENRRRGGTVLRLAEKIGGANLAVDRVVGDDERFGWAGEKVDADAAIELTLRLGDKGVAGSHQHVDRRDRLGSERHRGDGLYAAEHIDLVSAPHMHGRDDGGMRSAVERRGTGDDPLDAGHFRRHDAHMRRRDHGIFAAGYVAADRVHRNVLVTQNDAGQGLDFEVLDALALLPSEIAHLRLREADVLDVSGRNFRHRRFNLTRRQAKGCGGPFVEFLRQLAKRRVAARLDLRKYAFDRGAHFGVAGGYFFGVAAALQVSGHCLGPWVREGRPERLKRARDDRRYGFTVGSILVSLYKSAGGSHFWQLMPGSFGALTTSAGSGWIISPGGCAPSRADLRLSSGRNLGLNTSVTKELGTFPSGKALHPSSNVSPLQSVTLSAGTQGSGYWMFIAFRSRFFVRISIISLNA